MANDPLEGLIVEGDDGMRTKLAAALKGRVGLEPARDAVHILSTNGNARERVLLALLGRQALALYQGVAPVGLLPKQIADMTGVAPGTVRPTLMHLSHDRIVVTDEQSGYTIPNVQVDRAIALLKEAA
jgi:hypothetical protein